MEVNPTQVYSLPPLLRETYSVELESLCTLFSFSN